LKHNHKHGCIQLHLIAYELLIGTPNYILPSLAENPSLLTRVFNYMTFATMFQLDFFNLKIKLGQLPIKSTCLLCWYIVESIFELGVHLPNIPNINNVVELNAQLCW
jgi:hypothetical protein